MSADIRDELVKQMHELIKAQQKHINDLRAVLRNEDPFNRSKGKKPLDPSGEK